MHIERQKVKCESVSCSVMCVFFPTVRTIALQAPLSIGFTGKKSGVGSHSLLQGIFLTQGLNLGLLNCKQIQRVKVNIKKKKKWFQWAQTLASSHTQKNSLNSLTRDVWFSVINSNTLMFLPPGFCCKTLTYPGSSITSSEQSLRATWEAVFWT